MCQQGTCETRRLRKSIENPRYSSGSGIIDDLSGVAADASTTKSAEGLDRARMQRRVTCGLKTRCACMSPDLSSCDTDLLDRAKPPGDCHQDKSHEFEHSDDSGLHWPAPEQK